jgi:hypothetical protein
MLLLFYKKYDPATFQAIAQQNNLPKLDNYVVNQLDNYRFYCDSSTDLKEGDVGLLRILPGNVKVLWRDYYPDGGDNWYVVGKQ